MPITEFLGLTHAFFRDDGGEKVLYYIGLQRGDIIYILYSLNCSGDTVVSLLVIYPGISALGPRLESV